ncbi:hypothetical protein B9T10_03595 [Wohlfahrtiimonas chitiniclastica]|nr:hypothetical protein B9T14_01305 [Wohlfahrtiimonas chitiniclastica]OYQ86621.1 hypothetical protein B9T15_03735 [Wohlfahrtiimonas chitiniclastica]OYQ89703.1 hypothetical protein B9T21_02835 [Wohlfahrtiimonas chitiniclastica]OYQ90415.1 hypothetical protein B9T10_03595 [Wohlfahrtiimonas chitiniclastica]
MRRTMKKILYMIAIATVVVGCATAVKKQWGVVSGSKADGTVKLAYEYTEMEKPIVDMTQAETIATKRCAAWGYKKAEPFDAAMTSCVYGPGAWGGCAQYRVSMDYQCTNH